MSERPVRKILPPRLFYLSLAAQVPLVILNWPPRPEAWQLALGAVMVVTGTMLTLPAARSFGRARTGIVPFSEATTLVDGGPFRVTRNPMYLGMVLFSAGVATATGEGLNLIFPALLWAWLHFKYVLPEERFMADRFGAAYEAYRRTRPRWFWPI